MADKEKETLEQEIAEQAAAAAEEMKNTEAAGSEAAGNAETESREDTEAEAAAEGDTETCADESEEAENEEAPESDSEKKSWAEKMAAKKQAKQDKKADVYKEKIVELEDKNKRQLAEFENFRRRTEKEKQAMFEIGAKSVIEKILPVIDNFERGFATVDPSDEEDAFVKGMSQVYKQMMTELDKIGVKPIEAVGQEFDPNFHNAVMQVASEEYESGVVAQELLKGYTYHDSVVRHSMVAVVGD